MPKISGCGSATQMLENAVLCKIPLVVMSSVSDWQAVARRLPFTLQYVQIAMLPNLSRQHAILSLVKASTRHGVQSRESLIGA